MHSPVPPLDNSTQAQSLPASQPANSSYGSFLHDILFVCCGTIGAAYLIFLILGVPIAMIFIGFCTTNNCPAEPMIPIYLAISGIWSILRTIWYFLEFWLIRRHIGMVFRQFMKSAMCVMTAGMATLYLLGLYWVLSAAWPNLDDIDAYNYCNPATYLLALATIVGILVLGMFWCLCICSLASRMVPVVNEDIIGIDIPVVASPNTITAVTILIPETA